MKKLEYASPVYYCRIRTELINLDPFAWSESVCPLSPDPNCRKCEARPGLLEAVIELKTLEET